jgi:hypothetical protein
VRRRREVSRPLPAHDVHRNVRRNKTDRMDTEALLEADRNEDIYSHEESTNFP